MFQRRSADLQGRTVATEAASKAVNKTVSQIAEAINISSLPGRTPSERRENLIRTLLTEFRRIP